MNQSYKKSPWKWVPTLYFAQGLPYVAVMTIAVVMYKNLGMSNSDIAFYTGWLYLPWVIKPLWSPFVDLIKTLKAQNKKLEDAGLLAILTQQELSNSKKSLEDKNNELQKSITSLTALNTKLTKDLEEKNMYLETNLNQNISLQSEIFYYKYAFFTSASLMIIYFIYTNIIKKK